MSLSISRVIFAGAALTLAACAPAKKPQTAANPAADPRNDLKAGLFDAGEFTSNMRVVGKAVSPNGFLGITNSDLAFTGNYVIQGNYNGPVVWDISNPSSPKLVVAYECPASQNDVSVYKNLMFMSAEAQNGRIDCKPGGVREAVSKERMRGVRVFDISNIKEPKLVANVQTCRGSHTHTVLEDPKDRENIYIYVSGSSGIRPSTELEGCAGDLSASDPNSSRLRIEIIKVPLADPSKAAVVGRANIFTGLEAPPQHGLSDADKAAAAQQIATARASGAFIAKNPQSGADMVAPAQMVRPLLDSLAKARGASAPNGADSAAARPLVQTAVNRMFANAAPGGRRGVEGSQCHDITVYPSLGLAGGACEGHGLLLDISNPANPVRLDAAADSNFAYWHSATFNNDGTAMLFSDEWGGGGAPKCRAGDKAEWGANAIFDIVNDPNSSRLRIEIIKVPLADPSKAAVVGRANIFAGLEAPPQHGLSDADKAAAAQQIATARASGAFIAKNPQSGMDMVAPAQMVRPLLDSLAKARGASAPNGADSAAARSLVQTAVNRMFANAAPGGRRGVEGSQCHDITVYPSLGLAGGACEGHGLLIDISNPANPVRLDAAADSNFAYWHSATFNNDGTSMLFSDEWGGGGAPKCRAGDKPEWGANAIFDIVNDPSTGKKKLKFRSYYKIPTYQSSNENCVAHNGSLIPIPGRDIMVQAWYQGGISVFDWTDTQNAKEIASFDRGPVDGTRMQMGGSWSVYWYNGQIVSSEIARGMDVVQLTPSEHISQNEIDAANTVKWDQLNAQGQPKISWPPSFPLAKAFTDQLERKGCAAGAVTSLRTQIAAAEKASGAARNTALDAAVSAAEGARGCDAKKTDMLKKALQDLRAPAM